MRTFPRALFFAVTLFVGSRAAAETTMQVRLGWDGLIHSDRWNLAFVTLSDTKPRNVLLEFHTPYDSFQGMRIDQAMTIGPQAQTFPLYLPMRGIGLGVEELSVVVRDANSLKKLASFPSATTSLRGGQVLDPARNFIGVSGKRATLRNVTDALPGAMLQAGHLDVADLPADPIGYDCLDVFVLNMAEFSEMSAEQQQAIADWVRGGGSLILWPGDDSIPATSPLIDILPCRIGASRIVEIPADTAQTAGLAARFRKLPARDLAPHPGAAPVSLLGTPQLTAYRQRVGFGQVLVSPTDLTALSFADPKKTWDLWKLVLDGMVPKLPDDPFTPPERYYAMSDTGFREAAALRQVGDLLGAVPGAGRFGFGYIATVLIGMMVVVGPVDWFVLKKLGRQPWTWVTTTGWIGLVTLGAIYAGHLLKSGELHFRTFELVDQADGASVARTDIAGLYSPRTTTYDVNTPVDSWWQPASPGEEYYVYRRSSGNEMTFHQTYRGSAPEPMIVNVWNLRFLKGRAAGKPAGATLVDAALRITSTTGPEGRPEKHVVGTITNPGTTVLKNLAIRTKDGVCVFALRAKAADRIEPGKTVEIDAIIDPELKPATDVGAANRRNRGYYPGLGESTLPQMSATRLWDVGGYLSVNRTDRITQWLKGDDVACVYAECESPDPVAKLSGATPIERHWKVVRALVTLKK